MSVILPCFCFGFALVFLGHVVVVGVLDPEHPFLLDFDGKGVINIFWQGIMVAALAAQTPNIFIGTPVGEIRTMMLLGLIFAIPFLVVRMTRHSMVKPMAFVRPEVPADANVAGACA